MSAEKRKVQDIMIPLSGFPCMQESGTVREAIQQLRSFCPLDSTGPCGFGELMVVDGAGKLIGRVTQQGILRVLFATLLEPVDIKNFEGRTFDSSDLATLLDGVLIREGVNHLDASLTSVIETGVRTVSPDTDLINAMAIMVICRETVLPVTEDGQLRGIVKLAEVFGSLGDMLISLNSK